MNILSLFDGMSCGQIALNRAGIKYKNYYASEIDKHAIKVVMSNYPDTIQLGDITKWKDWDIEKPDLIMGGSPCQGFSFAGKQLNFNDPRSKLFFEFVEILNHYNPKYFLLENVKMKKEYQDVISGLLGVEPIEINSALVSAQNRKRLYWTNIKEVCQPNDKGIFLKDILEKNGLPVIKNMGKWINKDYKSQCLDANYFRGVDNHGQRTMVAKSQTILSTIHKENVKSIIKRKKHGLLVQVGSLYDNNSDAGRIYSTDGKNRTLKGEAGGGGAKMGLISQDNGMTYRKLTPIECERLQTVDYNYTKGVSDTQRYRMLGNGFTVDIISHILSYIK